MKIVHVLSSYLPNQIAGTEVYVSALVRELKKRNINSKVIIPNIGKTENEYYFFEETEIIKYAEPSTEKRSILTGNEAPMGLIPFTKILKSEHPDLVHFHEVAGGVGVGIFHVNAAKEMGFKTLMTFHLAKYTCKTGSLMYMNETKCDGVIRELQCSKCWLNESGETGLRFEAIKAGYTLMHHLNIDTRFLKNSLGTALALPKVIEGIRNNLLKLQSITDGFVVLTDWYKNILLKNGVQESHLSLIKQGLPVEFVEKIISEKKNGKLRLVFVGRVSHFKGLDILLLALKDIPQNRVDLEIYGAATEQDYLDKCLQISAGNSNVFWKGTIAPSLVINMLQEHDVLCIPSAVSEMGPFVLKEAFAAGIPVLASNVYGNAEQVIDGENGWLFKFKDVAHLKNIIEYLMENSSLIEEAKLKIPAVKSFETVAEEHEKLYKEILAAV